LQGTCDAFGSGGYLEALRLTPPGGPVFSLLLDQRSDDGLPSQVYLGNHAKQVLAWAPPRAELEAGVVLDGHCGWVRALASSGGRWLFSAACNTVHVWDNARAVPSVAATATLAKGDILALTASKDRLYTAAADGSIRAFSVGKRGELGVVAGRARAHHDRVTALALAGNLLFSTSYDGSIKAWDPVSLEIVVGTAGVHGGERVHCLVRGPDGLLYTGGDDNLVRRWEPSLLQEAAAPLHAHNYPVRALAAGGGELVVSADKGGEVAVWKVA
jgi:pleiotropic regulator 1